MVAEFRPLRESEFEALAHFLNKVSAADGKLTAQTDDELREYFESLHVELALDTLTAWADGALIGAVYTLYFPSSVRLERCFIEGGVDPQWRDREIGRQLMAWAMSHAESLLRNSNNSLPKFIRTPILESNSSAKRLMERFALNAVRLDDELHISLDSIAAIEPIAGIHIVGWDLARNEEARLVKESAFEDHWGSAPTEPEFWVQRTTGFGSRLDLSFLALDESNKVVGLLLTHRFPADDALTGKKYALIDNIAVLRTHRGRGIASALIAHALHAYKADSLEFANLGVDTDNPTGAYRLYTRLGFELLRRSVIYEREV